MHTFPNTRYFRLTPLMLALAVIATPLAAQPVTPYFSSQATAQSNTLNVQRFHRDHVLGTSLDVVTTGLNSQQATQVLHAIENEISRLELVLSTWRDDSEISQLNRTKQAQASADLFAVIAGCEQWRSQTCGAFDARLGELMQFWQAQQGIVEIDSDTRQHIVQQLSQNIQAANVTVTAPQHIQMDKAVTFAPDGYAKGYIIDRAILAARQAVPELEGLLIDIGGDMRVWGKAPQQAGWMIGIQDAHTHADNTYPTTILALQQQAVAVSGQGYRSLAGQSHLLDPKTGNALQQVMQCVVVGQCAANADALATALAAMSPEAGLQLIAQLVGYEARLTLTNGQIYQSVGWHKLIQTEVTAQSLPVAGNVAQIWPVGYQAILELNIPKIATEKYRAPYVSVWITDANKKRIRTLAVWGNDKEWINSNYVWWRRYGRQMSNLDSVAKPSRQPGQYKLSWDGKDDAGKIVAAGQYTVHIEASREHGGHDYQHFELDVKATPSVQKIAAIGEIGNLTLQFQNVH